MLQLYQLFKDVVFALFNFSDAKFITTDDFSGLVDNSMLLGKIF